MVRESNEQVLERIEEKRTLINNILGRKANWIGHILRINCLLHAAIEGQMTEVRASLVTDKLCITINQEFAG